VILLTQVSQPTQAQTQLNGTLNVTEPSTTTGIDNTGDIIDSLGDLTTGILTNTGANSAKRYAVVTELSTTTGIDNK
jgi:hypothetical protein